MLLLTADTDDQAEREIGALEATVDAGIGHVVKIGAQLAGLDPGLLRHPGPPGGADAAREAG